MHLTPRREKHLTPRPPLLQERGRAGTQIGWVPVFFLQLNMFVFSEFHANIDGLKGCGHAKIFCDLLPFC